MIELSMSMLSEFQRCRRKWYYHYVLGLEPKKVADYISLGSAFHATIAGPYTKFKEAGCSSQAFLEYAEAALASWMLTEDGMHFDRTEIPLVLDMLRYWWEQSGREQAQEINKVLAVEEHIPLTVGKYTIRCTPDLVIKKANGKVAVIDHKTVGKVEDALAFLPLDFQLRCYALTCWDKFDSIPEVHYNMVRRELPPDFTRPDGTQPYALTKTGRKSTRSNDPAEYVRLEKQAFTQKQLMAFATELEALCDDVYDAISRKRYPRSVIKSGAFGCGGCAYLAGCTRELDGDQLDGVTLSLEFKKNPSILEAA